MSPRTADAIAAAKLTAKHQHAPNLYQIANGVAVLVFPGRREVAQRRDLAREIETALAVCRGNFDMAVAS